jgi:hypothetical protein
MQSAATSSVVCPAALLTNRFDYANDEISQPAALVRASRQAPSTITVRPQATNNSNPVFTQVFAVDDTLVDDLTVVATEVVVALPVVVVAPDPEP